MFDSLVGIMYKDWMKLLSENKYQISPSQSLKAILVTILSLANVKYKKEEETNYAKGIEDTKIEQDPVFILGHWRSGTTFLHNLISTDEQFAYPWLVDVKNPSTFISRTKVALKAMGDHAGEKRAMDNMVIDIKTPSEEEFGLAVLTLKSPLLGWIFPRNYKKYDRYLSFRDVPEDERNTFKEALLFYFKKLTYKHNKQLLLKSPVNSARIRLLLEVFPNAKFINIHRNPYNVFTSTMKLQKTAIRQSHMQKPNFPDLTGYVLDRYSQLYDAFFEDKDLIPEQNYIDVRFEDLESDPLKTIKTIYTQLALNGFEQMKPGLNNYLDKHSNYRKNTFNELDETVRKRIQISWKRSFEYWGYEL